MNQIFLSYRREDSADVSGRINDQLAQHFGQDAIFTDVDSIPLGIDFQQYIDEQVGKCDIFLAVIGRDWLSVTDADGRHRLQQPGDFVRIEIESALRRNIPVIPLLVRRATIPSGDDLPDTLNELASRNGMSIRPNPDFHGDMKRLINGIEQHLSRQSEAATKRKVDEEQQRAETATETKHQAEEEHKQVENERIEREKVAEARRKAEEKRKRAEVEQKRQEAQRQAGTVSEQASSKSSKLKVFPGLGIRNIFMAIFLIAMVPGLYLWDQQQSENEKELIYQGTLAAEKEKKRLAEQVRKDEQARLAEQASKDEQARLAEQVRKDEQARLAEQVRKDEQARLAEQARKDEQARLAEQARKDEQAHLAEQARKEAESTASLSEQPTINADGSNIEISGTYISDISSTSRYFEKDKHQVMQINFVQTGNSIVGTNSSTKLNIIGTRSENNIAFYIPPPNKISQFQEITGRWKINADGTKLEGNWKIQQKGFSGKWNLTKKVGSVSDANLDQQAASVTPDTPVDISGTYRSDIIGSGSWSLGRFPNIEVILKQNKGEISGTFSGTRSGEIEGILNGDTIKFKWFVTAGRTESGRGEWKLTNDGINWNGTWKSSRGTQGNWNLTKIE